MSTSIVGNTDDVIDSRDVIRRIEELEAEQEDLKNDFLEADTDEDISEARRVLAEWNQDNGDELKALQDFAKQGEEYSEDWPHGATLIHESYFVDYCKEFCDDIGDIPKNMPAYIVIDWDATAENLKGDYTELTFDGETYFVR